MYAQSNTPTQREHSSAHEVALVEDDRLVQQLSAECDRLCAARRPKLQRAVGDLKFETRLSAEERVVERGMHLSVVRKDRRTPR